MSSRNTVLVASLAAILLVFGPLSITANAQSDNDLRRENQSLTTRVRDLEAELKAAREQIEQLQKEIGRLEGLLEAGGGGGQADQAPPPEPERQPWMNRNPTPALGRSSMGW